ncbi:HAD family hydrolase [Terriglobus roseus]|uniref:Putative hydrolase of the HAD superfamily n=1 Tax=Terriglobus roseus TaxID=392734 RepID=A0A1G7IZM6_9BACT|nr:HAD family phosphatase [Terriglobus roseus]SDF18192.1 putative hydrolase of the HAD superfamily [Terriglobus roseus]
MPQIRAVLFDFGKVLTLAPDPRVWEQMRTISHLSEEELHDGYWKYRDDYDAGILTGDEYWRLIAGESISADVLRDLKAADVALWTQMNQPMLQWVAALHQHGFRTGILSNMPDAMAEGIVAQFDWIANFHHTVWSYALKLRKPQPEIYAVAAEGLKTPPADILFIDDKPENTEAAEAFGMQAIVYENHDDFIAEMRSRGFSYLLEPESIVSA